MSWTPQYVDRFMDPSLSVPRRRHSATRRQAISMVPDPHIVVRRMLNQFLTQCTGRRAVPVLASSDLAGVKGFKGAWREAQNT